MLSIWSGPGVSWAFRVTTIRAVSVRKWSRPGSNPRPGATSVGAWAPAMAGKRRSVRRKNGRDDIGHSSEKVCRVYGAMSRNVTGGGVDRGMLGRSGEEGGRVGGGTVQGTGGGGARRSPAARPRT
ncbi:MAG TPA: hypothetical protein VG940_09185, partial [Gemmatimonadales bacterium]|nr:hypothetical protein [Gemmatimonadales bacterium]